MADTYKLEEVKRGDKGNSVFLVQQMLKARELKPGVPFYNGELDKEFGPKTEKAVKDYQTIRIAMGAKLGKADGIVGPKTWEDLLGLAKV